MQEKFTEFIENKVASYPADHCDDERYFEEIDFLNNDLRKFGSGLSELMEKCGYNGSDDPLEKADYLDKMLNNIGVSFTKVTLKKWFSNDARPKVQSDSREKMFQICFALGATAEVTKWFFHHVYFDRCFDCRQLKEAVYLFCMKNGKTYEQAVSLYEKVSALAEISDNGNSEICYTVYLNNEISSFHTEEEFIEYVKNEPQNFKVSNKKIREYIALFVAELSHPEADKAAAEFIKSIHNAHEKKLPKDCGLILRWLYEINSYDVFTDIIYNKDVTSKEFLICAMTESVSGINNSNIPSIIRTNFPSKKTLSDIIEKQGYTSYDAMRKLLILLKFTSFWCNCRLAHDLEYSSEILPKIFIDEMNCVLSDCGYGELFAGNPYDWVFMHSAYADDPMSFMQGFVQLDVE